MKSSSLYYHHMMMMVMMIMLTSSRTSASENSPTSGEYETIISDTISDISEFTEHQVLKGK